MRNPARYLSARDRTNCIPVHAVWELTLACDLKCLHCGSRAGKRRPKELSTSECLDLVRQLARLGTREVTLIGGEAYLRKDWTQIIRGIRETGMECTLQSGGLHLDPKRITQAAEAGLQGLGISIDGLAPLHDQLRGVSGSFAAAFKALNCARSVGLVTSVNTQITSLVIPQLRELMDLIISSGAKNWQVQLTVAMGRAADNPELLLQPCELLDLMPLLADLYKEGLARGLLLQAGNNIGFFGPYESLWRGSGNENARWSGCNAGQNTIGIEADGTIKGCPSLPTTPYSGGNILDRDLEYLWQETPELALSRTRTTDELWGFCRSCYYAEECLGGCTWTAHALLGRPGNNPYCHHRVLELAAKGLRERVVKIEDAPGKPFDHGRFALVLEAITENSREAVKDGEINDLQSGKSSAPFTLSAATDLVQIGKLKKVREERKAPRESSAGRRLEICRHCKRHVRAGTLRCPFCKKELKITRREYAREMRKARESEQTLVRLLQLN